MPTRNSADGSCRIAVILIRVISAIRGQNKELAVAADYAGPSASAAEKRSSAAPKVSRTAKAAFAAPRSRACFPRTLTSNAMMARTELTARLFSFGARSE